MISFPVDDFFNSGLEEDATLTTAAGAKPIKVIFDDKYAVAKVQGIDIESSSPQALCRSVDVESAKRNDKLSVRGTDYYIRESQPDVTGLTNLILSYD